MNLINYFIYLIINILNLTYYLTIIIILLYPYYYYSYLIVRSL